MNSEEVGDENAERKAKGVRSEGLTLIEAVGLLIGSEATSKLDEGSGGGAVIGQKVEEKDVVERVTVGEPPPEENTVNKLAGGGGVCVLDVEGGVGNCGGAQIDV